jgi:hypothetical protein
LIAFAGGMASCVAVVKGAHVALLDSSSLPSSFKIPPQEPLQAYEPQVGERQPGSAQLERAILETLIYADLFEFPLLLEEITRYLPLPANAESIRHLLEQGCEDGTFEHLNGFFTLPGRSDLVSLRMRREAIAQQKWLAARRPLRWIARLPFVRLVAVTGSLAVNNVEEQDDVDLFIVTAAGRLWLCRAFVILVVRLASRMGVVLCPNYFLSAGNLSLKQQSFFDARELTQMVPLYGSELYRHMRSLNSWALKHLPQAAVVPSTKHAWLELSLFERACKQAVERLLSGRLGSWLESWEMERKVRRFNRRAESEGGRVLFTPDCCKGHFAGHGEVIPLRFQQRLAHYGVVKEQDDG